MEQTEPPKEALNQVPDKYITKVVAASEFVKHYTFIKSCVIVSLVAVSLMMLFRTVFMAQAVILVLTVSLGVWKFKFYSDEIKRLTSLYGLQK